MTILGIIIGVASVILLVSIGSGLQSFVTKEFESLGSNILFISPGKVSFSGGPPRNLEAKFDFDDVRNISELGEPIIKATGMISKGGTIKYRSKSYYGSMVGVTEEYLEYGNVEIEVGNFFSKSNVERGQMVGVIGHKVYSELFGEEENAVGKKVDVSGGQITIVGVLKEKGGGLGGASDENSFVLIPVTTAIKITGIKRPVAVMVRTASAETTQIAAEKIKKYFYRRKLTDDDFTILEPKELLASINSFWGVVTGALSGIATISLVVGGIGIAIGWEFSAILRQFIETSVTLQSVGMAFGISALVGIVSGFLPALRASRLDPIEALRYE